MESLDSDTDEKRASLLILSTTIIITSAALVGLRPTIGYALVRLGKDNHNSSFLLQ